jgi:hypothetical protein
MSFMRVDAEVTGIFVAIAFVVLGLVALPEATWFFLGTVLVGVVIALLLRFTSKKFTGVVLGAAVVLMAVVLWWAGRPPQRPQGVSPNALHLDPNNAGSTLHKKGYWLDCWFDRDANLDRCRHDGQAVHGSNRRIRESTFLSFTCRSIANSCFPEVSTQKPGNKAIVLIKKPLRVISDYTNRIFEQEFT